jgi:hypothetical protein
MKLSEVKDNRKGGRDETRDNEDEEGRRKRRKRRKNYSLFGGHYQSYYTNSCRNDLSSSHKHEVEPKLCRLRHIFSMQPKSLLCSNENEDVSHLVHLEQILYHNNPMHHRTFLKGKVHPLCY